LRGKKKIASCSTENTLKGAEGGAKEGTGDERVGGNENGEDGKQKEKKPRWENSESAQKKRG